MEKERNNRLRHVEKIVQSLLLFILIILIFAMMLSVKKIQGTARIVNYTGIVRGATQRLVKLEITGYERQYLINYLDYILISLQHGDNQYQLVKLEDADYQESLSNQLEYWEKLKDEITNVRSVGYENTDIVEISEKYYYFADKTVSAAEQYSEECASHISTIELMSIICIVGIVAILLKHSIIEVQMAKANKALKKKAYIDIYTGLPNRSRCEEILNNSKPVTDSVCCIMFDLNNLKAVNDSLGHMAGDTMILNFAHILQAVIPKTDFVGRYGGDEFIAVLTDTDEKRVNAILNTMNAIIAQSNLANPDKIGRASCRERV